MTQLDLTGAPSLVPPAVRLTTRQRIALEHVAEHQPVSADEIGARLHAYRRQQGGHGHSIDARCQFCAEEGNSMLRRLRELGLVRRKMRVGWVTVRPVDSGSQGDLPEGF